MANNQFYRGRQFNKPKENRNFTRVNFYIKSPQVRVVQDGNQLGVFPIETARKMAQDAGLDLVEIVPNVQPPVCSICDFDKFRYEQKKQEKENKKKQASKQIELKEVRLRPCTQAHDIEVKANAVLKFLAEGKKVLLTLEYKKRELSHREEGYKIINAVIEHIKEAACIEQQPKMHGNKLNCLVVPKKAGENVRVG